MPRTCSGRCREAGASRGVAPGHISVDALVAFTALLLAIALELFAFGLLLVLVFLLSVLVRFRILGETCRYSSETR